MIAAGKEEIRQWFSEGVAKGARYMLIVYDQMDFSDNSDSPFYAESEDSARSILREFNRDSMCKVMEIYDLSADREAQLAEKRAWRLPEVAYKTTPFVEPSEQLANGKTRLDFVQAQNRAYIKKYFDGHDDVSVYDSDLYTDDDKDSVKTNGACIFTSRGAFTKTGAAVYHFSDDGKAKVNYIRLYDSDNDAYDLTPCRAEAEVFRLDHQIDDTLYVVFVLWYIVKNVALPEEEDQELHILKTFSRQPGARRFRIEISEMGFFRREGSGSEK